MVFCKGCGQSVNCPSCEGYCQIAQDWLCPICAAMDAENGEKGKAEGQENQGAA